MKLLTSNIKTPFDYVAYYIFLQVDGDKDSDDIDKELQDILESELERAMIHDTLNELNVANDPDNEIHNDSNLPYQ